MGDDEPPAHEALVADAEIRWSAAGPVDAHGLQLRASRLQQPVLAGARLPLLDLDDVVVAGGDLANADLREATWRRVEVRGARLTGVRLTDARLEDVVLRDCRIDLAALGGARLRRVAFVDCRMTGCDLQDLRGEDLLLEGCDLRECDLTGARFSRAELRGCPLEGARGLERLRGVGMRWEDVLASAGAFAGHLGIRLTDG